MRSAVRLAVVGFSAAVGVFLLRWTTIRVPCPIHEATGLYCPGCGITRSAEALVEGDVALALRQYSLLPIVVIAALWFVACWIAKPVGRLRIPEPVMRRVLVAVVVIAVSFGAVRNVPQFGVLRPL